MTEVVEEAAGIEAEAEARASRATKKARAELGRGRAKAADWRERAAGLRAQVADAEGNLGQATLDADDPAVAAQALRELRDAADAAERAAEAAEAACVPLERAALLAEANDERELHARLDAGARRHQAKTEDLLARLAEHEQGGDWGCRWGNSGLLDKHGPRTAQLRIEAEMALARVQALEVRAADLRSAS